MDGERWWIVDEIARWWREASEEARGLLMQRALDGCEEATLEEVRKGAVVAEICADAECGREALAQEAQSRQFLEAWAASQRQRRR